MNTKKALVIGAALVLGGLSIACGGASTGSSSGGTTKDKPIGGGDATSAPATTAAAPPADPNAIDGDGTFAVPDQVKPGTYRTVVPTESLVCYWERLKSADGSFDSIIANGTGNAGSQQIVQIKSTDKFFKTDGCGTWTKVS